MPVKVFFLLAAILIAVGGYIGWALSGAWYFALAGGVVGVLAWIVGVVFELFERGFILLARLGRTPYLTVILVAVVFGTAVSALLYGDLVRPLLVGATVLGLVLAVAWANKSRRAQATQQPAQQPVVTPLIPTGPAQAGPARQTVAARLNTWQALLLGFFLGVLVNIVDYALYSTVFAGFGTIVVVMAIVSVATRPRPEVTQQQAGVDLTEAERILELARAESAAAIESYLNARRMLSDAREILEEFRTARQATGLPQEPQGGPGDEPAANPSSRLHVTRRTSPVTPVESEGGDEPQATDDPQGSDEGPSESDIPSFLRRQRPNPA